MVKGKNEMTAEKDKTFVYVARVSNRCDGAVYPEERNALIKKTSNEGLKRERYSVWKLLEYALKDSFSVDIKDLKCSLTECGKWIADGVCFSLSHTSELVAVALSENPIGVDIERVRSTVSKRIGERILNEEELLAYSGTSIEEREEFIIRKWSGKEALFKKNEISSFVPHDYCPNDENTRVFRLSEGDSVYILTVATEEETVLRDLRSYNIL